MEVQSDVRLCTVTEGLTEDAVSARLVQGGSSLHLRLILPTLKQWLSYLPCFHNCASYAQYKSGIPEHWPGELQPAADSVLCFQIDDLQ